VTDSVLAEAPTETAPAGRLVTDADIDALPAYGEPRPDPLARVPDALRSL
jgi:hypothetical protein